MDGDKKKKEKVRLHHYVQSFKPGEVTPEEAHEIGVKWAKEVFGENRQVLVTTHIDKGHIHNHCAVAAYDLDGKAWYGNKRSLKRSREISDRIAKEHGLSIIERPVYRANHKYGEWLARKNGTSWKQKLCDDIDRLILQKNVNSVNDLVDELRKMGYEVNYGKYISIKAVKNRRPIRSFRLGNNYRNYLQQMQSDYDFILEKLKREKAELEKAAKISEQQKEQEEQNIQNSFYI